MKCPDTFIAPDANIIGTVSLGEGSSVWFGSIVRADLEEIRIGCYSNIQDGCVLHVSQDCPIEIGNYVSIGHRAVVHGSRISHTVLVGIGAIVLDQAEVGEGSIIGAGAVVPPGMVIPPRSLALGVPARIIREVTPEEIEVSKDRARRYYELWREKYRTHRKNHSFS